MAHFITTKIKGEEVERDPRKLEGRMLTCRLTAALTASSWPLDLTKPIDEYNSDILFQPLILYLNNT